MSTQHHLAALAAKTVAASVALACAFMLHRNPPVNLFTFEAAIAFESMLEEECYNAWFCRHLRCSQETFRSLCSMLRARFHVKPFKKFSFERAVACTLFHLGSSVFFRETAQAFGVSKAWCIVNVNMLVRELTGMRATCIKLPQTPQEWDTIINGFRQVRGFPFCCGAMDDTLIAIDRPRDFEGWYMYNRKCSIVERKAFILPHSKLCCCFLGFPSVNRGFQS
ncbi:hypothetical protein PF010_g12870 [Phytophthora fragariae]|uniref:DDE Tnp4 domain-containing protein n=1 Tax=Phytophthora fragariae TaxID=53985 RepID=A0A6G0L1I7_9STRA|nr:hypothetical protein PF010_g12870 [Phytophthora fragariae]